MAAANVPEALGHRLAWSGLIFVGLSVVALAVAPEYPASDASTTELADFYGERNRALAGASIEALATAFFVGFLGALRSALRSAEGESGPFSAVAVIAGSVVAAGLLIEEALNAGLVLRNEQVGPAALQTVFDMANVLATFLAFPIGALVAAASLSALATGVLPRHTATGGLLVAALQIPAGFSLASDGVFSPSGAAPLIAVGVFGIWIVVVAVELLRPRGG
jgi:hypothetical protein